MPGDAALGAVLRELREAHELTLIAVARRVPCSFSLLSYVEAGQRALQPWLAEALDRIYRTGSVVACLARGAGSTPPDDHTSEVRHSDIFVVSLPQGGIAMPLSRRAALTALGVGVVTGELQGEFERALDGIKLDGDVLASLEDTYTGFKKAAWTLPPARLIDPMTGQVAVLDGLRRRSAGEDQRRCGALQAHYAESLSWLSEEAGDLQGAMWWSDRASQWAQAAGWSGMIAWGFVRRSSMAVSFSHDGLRVVDQAKPVLEMRQASPRMKGLAAQQVAYGWALAGDRDESRRAFDAALGWLAHPACADDGAVDQLVRVDDNLVAVHQATCDVYLGYGAQAIPVLASRLESFTSSSLRRATIIRAKLTWAYANAGQPAEACQLAWDTLDTIEQVGSHYACSQLRRAVPVLSRWHGRSDVQDVLHRLAIAPVSAT